MTSRVAVGDKYSKLLVVERAGLASNKGITWLCRCDCGTEKVISGAHLKNGNAKSCGCYRSERLKTHGNSGKNIAPEYRIWGAMIGRCERPSDKRWKNYGGRGIRVCQQWRQSYAHFLSDMGNRPTPDHTIDRIDSNGDYEPGNCRWSTMAEQQRNRTNNHNIEWNGRSMTAAEWEREVGLPKGRIHHRIKRLGWTVQKALSTPCRPVPSEAE